MEFKVTTCCHGTPALQFDDACRDLHRLLCNIVTCNRTDHEYYRVSKEAGAFLQGGHDLEEGFIMIEFWKPQGAQAFVDFAAQAWQKEEDKFPVITMAGDFIGRAANEEEALIAAFLNTDFSPKDAILVEPQGSWACAWEKKDFPAGKDRAWMVREN